MSTIKGAMRAQCCIFQTHAWPDLTRVAAIFITRFVAWSAAASRPASQATTHSVLLLVMGLMANDAYRESINPNRDPATQLGIEYLNRAQHNDPGFKRLLELSQAESRH